MKNGLMIFKKGIIMDANRILFNKANKYGFRSWFPNAKLSNYPLANEKLLAPFKDAISEANNIDCIWFDGDKKMPALFKICNGNFFEGLCRLNNLKELIPPYYSKYFLIVADSDYQIALSESLKPTFSNSGILIITQSELIHKSLN